MVAMVTLPFAKLPESKMKESIIARAESLAWWNDVLEDQRSLCDHGDGCYVPAVAQVALVKIKSASLANDELGVRAYLMWSFPDDATRRLLRVVK